MKPTPATPAPKKTPLLAVTPDPAGTVFKPFDEITVNGFKNGTVKILDGNGQLLLSRTVKGKPFTFKTGGALGTHTILWLDAKGLKEWTTYRLDAKTEINDAGGRYKSLLAMLRWTMLSDKWHDPFNVARYNGKTYEYFFCWLRDHVHTLKGMKYFCPGLKSAIELYAEHQREDGMVFDNIYPRDQGRRPNWWDKQFGYGGFIEISDDGEFELKRIPVECDVEYLFLEGVYFTWKATGDTEWMKSMLDKALKAVAYSTTSPYRWSEKYQLLKRGYTIDTWDFVSEFDAITSHRMVVEPGKTQFSIMHGDNTGFANGLACLAEMLDTANRAADATRVRKLEKGIRQRLDKLSWNGAFFRHQVPEDPSFTRDFGVDPETQVSLSNAYSANRGVTRKQVLAIIGTYERLRAEMPASSPGEWFGIYPPFQRGYLLKPWDYVNGGVLSIVAGELARAAFENGREKYGVHALDAMAALAKTTKDYLYSTYRGAMPEPPARAFTPLSLARVANGDLRGKGAPGVRGWFDNDPNNDLANLPTGRCEYAEIPFDVVDPAANNAKSCLLLAGDGKDGFAPSITLPVNQKAASIYFLHATSKGVDPGAITLEYADGSTAMDYINGAKVSTWYMPEAQLPADTMGKLRLGWWGATPNFNNVGCVVYGFDNPSPGKEIKSIRFDAFRNGIDWGVLGVTLCDAPVFFMPNPVSHGIPDKWGAAAVVYGLVEGLAGVKDAGVAFDSVRFTPRWESAGVDEVSATIKYEASGGYVGYTYRKQGKTLLLQLTGNASFFDVELLLPEKAAAKSVSVNGFAHPFAMRKVEQSAYCCFTLENVGVWDIAVEIK